MYRLLTMVLEIILVQYMELIWTVMEMLIWLWQIAIVITYRYCRTMGMGLLHRLSTMVLLDIHLNQYMELIWMVMEMLIWLWRMKVVIMYRYC